MKVYETYNKVIAVIVAAYSTIIFSAALVTTPIVIFADQLETTNAFAAFGIASFSLIFFFFIGGALIALSAYLVYLLLTTLSYPFFYLISRFAAPLNNKISAKLEK